LRKRASCASSTRTGSEAKLRLDRRRGLRSPAELSGRARPVELGAAALEPEVGDDRFRPRLGRHRDARVERIRRFEGRVEGGSQLVEPLLRPRPLAFHLDADPPKLARRDGRVDEHLAALESLEAAGVGVARRSWI